MQQIFIVFKQKNKEKIIKKFLKKILNCENATNIYLHTVCHKFKVEIKKKKYTRYSKNKLIFKFFSFSIQMTFNNQSSNNLLDVYLIKKQ